MTAYITRRLLLMIPTLIGITFLVFMLIAMSPGGIGAAIRHLEDRYGLDDPVLTQYVRWLGRISPLKFGSPDQIDPTGEFIRPPKPIKPPPLIGEWYDIGVAHPPGPPLPVPDLGATSDERSAEYRRAANAYAQARAAFIAARTSLEQALRDYATTMKIPRAVERNQDLNVKVFRREGFDPGSPAYRVVLRTGLETVLAMDLAEQARQRVDAAFRAKPYREAVWSVHIPWTEISIPLRLGPVHLGPPDFGRSFAKGVPVLDLIASALPVTLLLNLLAFPIIYMIAVPTGIVAATRQGTWIDICSGALFVALWSIPVVWAGVLAVGYLSRDEYLGWFPTSGIRDADANAMLFLPSADAEGHFQRGYLLDTLWHLCLPVACLVYTGFAVLSKQTRAAMLDNFNADYVRTAKAKGVSGRDVVLRHVLRNSLLPLITLFATLFPALLSGSVVIERIFTVPGMGSLIIDSINLRDRELLLANALMIGAINLLALLLADILYAMADPRISYE
jgi:peptide/nickel transport system permease protein